MEEMPRAQYGERVERFHALTGQVTLPASQ